MSIDWTFQWSDLIIFLVVVFVGALLYILMKRSGRPQLVGLSFKEIDRRWKEVEDLFSVKKEMNYKLAIIEADKLLDHVLKAYNFQGETIGDRLKIASYRFPRLKKVMWAHRVRNQIVHEANYHVRHGETRLVLKLYKKALRLLRAL
jgi:hypothetical protein